MRFSSFLLFICFTKVWAQTPCSDFDHTIDSVLVRDESPKVSFLASAFRDYKNCLQEHDSSLFNRLKYFDFVLKGDNNRHIGMINGHYVLLDNNYRFIKEIDPGSHSTSLKIAPFRNGYAKFIGEQEKLIDTNGTILNYATGNRIFVVKGGLFVEKSSNEVVLFSPDGSRKSTWNGYLFQTIRNPGPYIFVYQWKKPDTIVMLDENGTQLYDRIKGIGVVPGLIVITRGSGEAVVLDSSGAVVFKSDSDAISRFDFFGVVTKLNGRKGFFKFDSRTFYPLGDKNYYPVSDSLLLQEENSLYGLITIRGEELYPTEYQSSSEWETDYFYKNDEVFARDGSELKKLPITKKQWEDRSGIGNHVWIIPGDTYRLFNGRTDEFSPLQFDSIHESVIGDKILTGRDPLSLEIYQNDRFEDFLCKENGKYFIMNATFSERISPFMDSIYLFGTAPFKFKIDGKWGVISYEGKMVCPAVYDRVQKLTTNYYAVKTNGKTGLLRLENKLIIPCEYDEIIPVEGLFFAARKGTDTYFFDAYGNRVFDHPVTTASIAFENGQLKCYSITAAGKSVKVLWE